MFFLTSFMLYLTIIYERLWIESSHHPLTGFRYSVQAMRTWAAMDTIEKLENSVQVFIGIHEKLRTEKSKTIENTVRSARELEKARDTIDELHKTIEQLKEYKERCFIIDTRKKQIKQQIDLIINKLNKPNNI